MADLARLADLADVVSGAVVIGGVAFAVVQLRQYRRQREDSAALEFVAKWDAREMAALDVVYGLPDAAPPEAIERDPAVREAANLVYVRFEDLGIMVHQRFMAIRSANEWAGGAVRVAWRKLRPGLEAKRARAGSQRPGEWFQWLAERFAELPARDEDVGAHVVHRHWKP